MQIDFDNTFGYMSFWGDKFTCNNRLFKLVTLRIFMYTCVMYLCAGSYHFNFIYYLL